MSDRRTDAMIEVEGLNKSYDENQILHNVSFTLEEGRITCLMGPSGSGKTTILRVLAGLEKMDGGSLTYRGRKNSLDELREDSTVVFQDFNLWPNKTVLENIILAPILTKKCSREEAVKAAETLLKKFGLASKRDVYPDFLSGGQRQRVAILRALAIKPKILFLDEITSALDPELIRSVLQMIKVLAKEGQTMLVSTHHLRFATEIADKILFLDNGRMIQEANPRDFIFAQSNLRISDYIQQQLTNSQEINVYEGVDEFQAYHIGSLKELPKNSTIYVVGASGDRWYEIMGDFLDEYEGMRERENIKLKVVLYYDQQFDKEARKKYPGLNEYRIIPKNVENPANYLIVGDSVVIQTFGKKPAVIEIHNPDIAKSYLHYFNILWETGKKVST